MMKQKNILLGLAAALFLCLCGCGVAAPVALPPPPLNLAAIVLSDPAGSPCGESIEITIDDTLVLTAALPAPAVVLSAQASGAVQATAEGAAVTLTTLSEGDGELVLSYSAEGQEPVQRTVRVVVGLREQELTAALVPVPELLLLEDESGLGDNSENAAADVNKSEAPGAEEPVEEPKPTCSFENGVLTVQTGTSAALNLAGELGTEFTLEAVGECADATLRNDLLVVSGREPGEMVATVTGEKEKFAPALLKLTVRVVLPAVELNLTAQGLDPFAPAIEIGGNAKITVAPQPKEAVLTVESGGASVIATLAKNNVLTLTGKAEGNVPVTLKAVCAGYSDAVLTLPVTVTAKRAALGLSCPQMGVNNTVTLLEGAQTKVTAAIGAGCALTYESKDNAVAVTREGNVFSVSAESVGTAKVSFLCKADGLHDNAQTLTFVVTRPQIALSAATAIHVVPGSTGSLRYSVNPADAAVTASCDSAIAETACENGTLTVKAKTAGRGVITLTAKKEGYATRAMSVYLTAGQAPVQLTLGSAYLSGTPGNQLTVSCRTNPDDARVTAKISNSSVATVDYSGGILTVSTLSPGSATITVTASKEGYSAATRTVNLSVGEQALTLNVSPTYLDVDGGPNTEPKNFDIKVSVSPSDATVKYTVTGSIVLSGESSTGASALVSGAGKIVVRASKSGYATVERVIQASPYGVQEQTGDVSGFAGEVFSLVNKERAAMGIAPLSRMSDVEAGANTRAQEIKQKFSHTRPNGKSFYSVFGIENNYYYGENIAYGQATPKGVMNSWMNSSGHRANILNERYTGIGIGVYQSGGTVYWVQIFKNSTKEQNRETCLCAWCTKTLRDDDGCTGNPKTCTCICSSCDQKRKAELAKDFKCKVCTGCTNTDPDHLCTGGNACDCSCTVCKGNRKDTTITPCTVCSGCQGIHPPGLCNGNRSTCPCSCAACEPEPPKPSEPEPPKPSEPEPPKPSEPEPPKPSEPEPPKPSEPEPPAPEPPAPSESAPPEKGDALDGSAND